jgi:hypothetical protein
LKESPFIYIKAITLNFWYKNITYITKEFGTKIWKLLEEKSKIIAAKNQKQLIDNSI